MSNDYRQILRHIYSSPETDIGHQIGSYKNVYDLPSVEYEWVGNNSQQGTDEGFFKYASRVRYFIVLALYYSYDFRKTRLFLIHSADENKAEASLPGGAVEKGETIQETVQRMARRCHPDVQLGEVEPIAVLTHKFRLGDDVHVQSGLAYVARVTNHDDIRTTSQPFRKLEDINLDQVKRYSNRKICEVAIARLTRKLGSTGSEAQVDREADSQRRHARRYRMHQRVVKPYIFDPLRRPALLTERLLRAIGSGQLILDASCGDSDFLVELAEEHKRFCVGNDVAWSQVVSLLERLKTKPADLRFRMLFTNHNIAELPFASRFFDVTLCKNTLHHFNTEAMFDAAMGSMARVSKRLVIVDIEDPMTSGVGPRAVNWYYRKVLGDEGEKFLRFDQFEATLSGWARVKNAKCEIDRVKTVWGNSMIATIDLASAAGGGQ